MYNRQKQMAQDLLTGQNAFYFKNMFLKNIF